jgi:prevent-host-death family protein
MQSWQAQEARRQFRKLLDDALEKGPQRVARPGKRAVVVISEEEWKRLSGGVPSFGELLAACPIEPADLPKRRPARTPRLSAPD